MADLQAKHMELRKDYKEGLRDALVLKRFLTAEEGTCFYDEQKARQMKALSNRESAKLMHSKIRDALHRGNTGGLSRIEVPDTTELFAPDGTSYGDPEDPKTWKGLWRPVTDPAELEDFIFKINIKQYHQAHNTPFGQVPLATLFGRDGTTEFAKNFLEGKPIGD